MGLMLELREQGLSEISGDIVLDRTLFRPARLDIGVPPFDEAPEFAYNVIPDALQLAGNLHGLELQSDAHSVQARLVPGLPGVRLDNRLSLNDEPCKDWDERGWKTPLTLLEPSGVVIVLQGSYPRDCRQRAALQLMERNLQAQAQLRWLCKELGLRWSGGVREGTPAEFEGTRVLSRRESRPLGEYLRQINKTSDNPLTRLLYLQMGVQESGRLQAAGRQQEAAGDTRALAEASLRRWFDEQAIAQDGLVLDNGSGLSRTERISAAQMVAVLQVAAQRQWAPELIMSLPVAGADGSLRQRMVNTPAAGRARLKGGSLRNVAALAGYVTDLQGRTWVMSAMVNHEQAAQARPALDALVVWLASGGH